MSVSLANSSSREHSWDSLNGTSDEESLFEGEEGMESQADLLQMAPYQFEPLTPVATQQRDDSEERASEDIGEDYNEPVWRLNNTNW